MKDETGGAKPTEQQTKSVPVGAAETPKPQTATSPRAQRDTEPEIGQNKSDCMTPYEFVSLLFSGLTFAALVVTATVYYYQLREMRKTTEATKIAADAAKNAADIAARALSTDARAWIVPYDVSLDIVNGKRLAKVLFRNTGKTPAIRACAHIGTTFRAEQIPQTEPEEGPSFLIAPDGISNSSIPFNETQQRLFDSGSVVYLYGTIWYDDIFKKRHWTQYCYVTSKDSGGFGPGPVHNACDDVVPSDN